MATYVCSDIHGLKDRYEKMIQCIGERDQLYVLGDVVDCGPFGVTILQDIMKRKNIQLLLGNHEDMMLSYYRVKQGYEYNSEAKETIIKRWEKNHCEPTIKEFECLATHQQLELLTYLAQLPVAYCDLMVNERMFYLVHGAPVTSITTGMISQEEVLAKGCENRDFIWERIEEPKTFFNDRTVIIGHTPTSYMQELHPYEIWTSGNIIQETSLINIDCGCALNDVDTQLALLRLDDLKVFYF